MCRQLYCIKTSCRKASKVASQVKWLAKPENVDHWKGAENVQRVQEWRKANPGYVLTAEGAATANGVTRHLNLATSCCTNESGS